MSRDRGGERNPGLEVPDPGHEPPRILLDAEDREMVERAIASLVPDFREIVILRDVEERSYEEIADILDVPIGTVRSRLHRARLELKALLADLLR
jgi:RNA polymerase sigma-70 factor (ECF subfamily)